MRSFLAACFVVFAVSVSPAGEVIINSSGQTTVVVPAQVAAEQMARTGILRHCGRAGGLREGIGFSSRGPEEAVRSCCFYSDAMRGRYRIVERGVARGSRGWYAVVRYSGN